MPSERLIRAIDLARSGHKTAAREILEDIVRAEPTNEAAWLWLADTQPDDAARLRVLREAQKHLPRSVTIAKAMSIINTRLTTPSLSPPRPQEPAAQPPPPSPPHLAAPSGPTPSTRKEPLNVSSTPPPRAVETPAASDVEALRRASRLRSRPRLGLILILLVGIGLVVSWVWPGSPLPGWIAVLYPATTATLEVPPAPETAPPLAITEEVATEEVLPTDTLSAAVIPEEETPTPPPETPTPKPTAGPTQIELGMPIFAMDWSPRVNLIALATQTGIGLYDATTLERVRYLENPANPPRLAFSPDGRWLVTNGAATRLWQVSNGEVVRTLSNTPVTALVFSPDGQQIALAGTSGQVQVLGRIEGNLPPILLPTGSGVFDLAFSPDGNRLAAALEDGRTLVWNLSTRTVMLSRIPETGRTLRLAFSPAGDLLAGGNEDGGIWLWDSEGKTVYILRGPSGMIFALTFAPDGKRLAASGEDPALYVWTLGDGQLQQRLEGPTRPVHGLRFSPDGRQLFSTDEAGLARFWALTP